MQPRDTASVAEFSDESFQKINLFESDELFVDIYCFRPGQAQAPHTHVEAEKVYHVLEGTATVLAGEEAFELTPGEIIHIPKGAPHGVRNDTDSVVRTLVMMAPLPGKSDETGGGHQHQHVSADTRQVSVITVSSSRSDDDDPSGDAIVDAIESGGHEVSHRTVADDQVDAIRQALSAGVQSADAVVLTGGTGITPDDVTIEAIVPHFDKELPGFGEHLRRLSTDEIGSSVIMTRATAGVVDETPVFALPGSTAAVSLAMEEIVLPELDHVVDLAGR